ncbi:MAG TPA: carbohydrate porin [Tepidisphaeraceae bacterium]|nr:carbohydrate porin [Tepidisphaeraceae bacterium]
MRIAGFALLGVVLGLPCISLAQKQPKGLLPIPDYTGDLSARSHLAGDFDGGRTTLAQKGVQIDVNWTQEAQTVVDGGRDTGGRYGGNVDTLVHLDLMRMGLIPGALVTIRAESRYGQSVNGIAGPILPVNTDGFFPLTANLDDGVCIAITDLNYTQFLSPQLAISAGKLDTLDADLNEFASGRGTRQFMNANFLFNSSLALRLPYSTLGVGGLWMPSPDFKVTASLINTVDSSDTTGFTDFGEGNTASIEADMQYRLGNLPGGANVGGLYSFDQDFARFGGELIFHPGEGFAIPHKNNTWAAYVSGWQYLLVLDPSDKPIDTSNGVADHKGIGVFGRFGVADQTTNPIDWSASVGIGGRGMIPGRDNDTFGVGYYYTHIQPERLLTVLRASNQAQGVEAYYNVAITPAINLTFDAQVVDDALRGTDNAIILGMRLGIDF